MATYFESNLICVHDAGDGFCEGDTYELLEVNGVRVVECDAGQIGAFVGKNVVVAGGSYFNYVGD